MRDAVDANALVAASAQIFEQRFVFLADLHVERAVNEQLRPLGERHNLVDDLIDRCVPTGMSQSGQYG